MDSNRALLRLLLLLPATALVLAGCGGGGFGGGGGGNVFVTTLALGPENYDLLSSLAPALTQDWYAAPVVGPVTIGASSYADGLKGEVFADTVRTGLSRYNLGGLYSAFGVVIGVASDEPDTPSWTAFRFWGDGRELATPHYVRKGERRTVIVDVRGVQNFDLIAEGIPQDDGFSYVSTRVGWASGTLIKEAGITYLADLTPTSTPGWTIPPTAGTMWIDWRPYPHSVVGTIYQGQPAARTVYDLGGTYKSLALVAGISQDETDAGATVTFEVLVDGVPRGTATIGRQNDYLVRLDVTGANTLELRATVFGSTQDAIDVGYGMALVATN